MNINLRQQVCLTDTKGLVRDGIGGIGVTIVFTYFFYRSIWGVFPMGILGLFYFLQQQREREQRRRREFLLQFKEFILAVSTTLKAGYAVENAILECEGDMAAMFGEDSRIVKEIQRIRGGLANHQPVEELLHQLGEGSQLEEIVEFADIFQISKRNGGNLPGMIGITSEMIGQRIECREEIQVYLASKKIQQKLMNVMPFGLLLYLDMTSPGFFKGLYHNIQGVLVMTFCLAVYLTAYILSKKIMGKAGAEG